MQHPAPRRAPHLMFTSLPRKGDTHGILALWVSVVAGALTTGAIATLIIMSAPTYGAPVRTDDLSPFATVCACALSDPLPD